MFREKEIELLESFINPNNNNCVDSIIVSSTKSVGKTYTVIKCLEDNKISYTYLKCDECITKTMFLTKCYNKIVEDIAKKDDQLNQNIIIENFSVFAYKLKECLTKFNVKKHVLVLDNFLKIHNSRTDLLLSFTHLREYKKIQNFAVIFIVSTQIPRKLFNKFVPNIYFKPYSEDEVIQILSNFKINSNENNFLTIKNQSEFWKEYIKLIVNSFFSYTGSNMRLVIDLCEKFWLPFMDSVMKNNLKIYEILTAYNMIKNLIYNDDFISNSFIYNKENLVENSNSSENLVKLPLHSKYILIASYICSLNDQNNDLLYFSNFKSVRHKKKSRLTLHNNKLETINFKKKIDKKLLYYNYFDVERLYAVISVIYRNESKTFNDSSDDFFSFEHENLIIAEKKRQEKSTFTLNRNIDLNTQISNLYSLGMIDKTTSLDPLNSKVKWKCNLNWNCIEKIVKDINFPINDYLENNES